MWIFGCWNLGFLAPAKATSRGGWAMRIPECSRWKETTSRQQMTRNEQRRGRTRTGDDIWNPALRMFSCLARIAGTSTSWRLGHPSGPRVEEDSGGHQMGRSISGVFFCVYFFQTFSIQRISKVLHDLHGVWKI